jgi:hypothetical protein
VEKFLVNHYCVASHSFESFMNYNKPVKRVTTVWIYYILLCIITLTFLLLAIINEPWIWILFAHPIFVMRKPNLIALCVGICDIYVTIIKTVIIYIEESPEFRPIIQLYFCNRNHYGLKNRYYRKFCLKSKYITKCFLGPFLS